MKARVKATGEIIEVEHTAYNVNGRVIWRYADIENAFLYTDGQLDFNLEENQKGSQIVSLSYDPDYWEKLTHQAAIGAMQVMLASGVPSSLQYQYTEQADRHKVIATEAVKYARSLVEELIKEESQCEK